ncbi:MAG: phosphomannomutase, partial [Bryobacteraceae bacterium]
MLNAGIFREYDIRGIAEDELRDADVEVLGRALATYLIRHSGRAISLGCDCRLSGSRLHDALLNGLLAAGSHVLDIGIVPTPVLYYSAVHFKTDGAVMITGSHNPPEYNGIKAVCGTSALHGQSIQDIYKLILSNDFESGEGSVKKLDAVTPYVDEIASQFRFEREVKVVVDAGNGTAGPVVRRVFEKLNVRSVEMFFDMDGHFPNHHPDPTVLSNLDDLKASVRKNKAEL